MDRGGMDDGWITFIVEIDALTVTGQSDVTFVKASCDVCCLFGQSSGSGCTNQQPGEKHIF